MPRRRMIDPQIWRNEKIGSLSDTGRLLFIGIFSQADDDGRPVVYAAPGDPFYDLSLYMYPERLSSQKLQGIVTWLEEHLGE